MINGASDYNRPSSTWHIALNHANWGGSVHSREAHHAAPEGLRSIEALLSHVHGHVEAMLRSLHLTNWASDHRIISRHAKTMRYLSSDALLFG